MAQIKDLPTEIIEMICCLVERRGICRLRLSCRELSAKASQGRFKEYFQGRTLVLSDRYLRLFADVTQFGGVACGLEELIIEGNINDILDFPAYPRNHVPKLLCRAFANIRASAVLQSALSVKLTIDPMATQHRCRDVYFEIVEQVLTTTMRALCDSGLAIIALDLSDCTTPCNLFVRIGSFVGLAASLCFLRDLNIMLTQHEELRGKHVQASEAKGDIVCGISRLLGLLPCLEVLHLEWHNHRPGKENDVDIVERGFFELVWPALCCTSSLRSITLRNIYISESALLKFLKLHSPHRVILKDIHLRLGTFEAIVERLSNSSGIFDFHVSGDCGPGTRWLHYDHQSSA